MKTFVAALLLLTLLAAALSYISLPEHRTGQGRQSTFPGYPPGGWDQVVR
jgi:hypothetical protein